MPLRYPDAVAKRGMGSADPETRTRVGKAGGAGRAAALTAAERAASARAAARVANAPPALARRIVRAWPDLSAEDQAEVIGILTAGLPLARRRGSS